MARCLALGAWRCHCRVHAGRCQHFVRCVLRQSCGSEMMRCVTVMMRALSAVAVASCEVGRWSPRECVRWGSCGVDACV